MATAQDVLRVAASQLGTTEFPAGSNRQKFSESLGRPAEPWCADFVVWCARQVGLKLPSESAYTPTMFAALPHPARPLPGDLAFFNFGSGHIQHVGFVESVQPDGLHTIEGNTSAGTAGSQDNGGGVYRRVRSTSLVVGYGRPVYSVPTPEVRPMYDPPIQITCVATLVPPDGKGVWMAGLHGEIFAWNCADHGAPNRHPEYWSATQTAARLEPFGNGYTVVDSAGHRYDYA